MRCLNHPSFVPLYFVLCYNLYCVGADVKPCSINFALFAFSGLCLIFVVCMFLICIQSHIFQCVPP